MRVVCTQEALKGALATAGRAAGGRSIMPILTHVLVGTDAGRLKIQATNLDLSITTWIPAHVVDDGQVTIPARLLTEFVNTLPPVNDVEIKVSGDLSAGPQVTLQSGRIAATMRGIDPVDFPPMAAFGTQTGTVLPARELRSLIDHTAFCAATEEHRPALMGVQVAIADADLTLSAADGYRLAIKHHRLATPIAKPLTILVPGKALAELSRLLAGDQSVVELQVTDNGTQAIFRVTDTKEHETLLSCRLLEGVFPDLARVIPKGEHTQAIVTRSEMVTAIRIANLFAKDAANVVRIDVTANPPAAETPLPTGEPETIPEGSDPEALPASRGATLRVSASAQQIGDNATDVDAQITGNPIGISLNSVYLAEVLGVLRTDQVTLQFDGPLQPAIIRGIGLEGYVHVIMPMHSIT